MSAQSGAKSYISTFHLGSSFISSIGIHYALPACPVPYALSACPVVISASPTEDLSIPLERPSPFYHAALKLQRAMEILQNTAVLSVAFSLIVPVASTPMNTTLEPTYSVWQ
jgi:hypothetical protein